MSSQFDNAQLSSEFGELIGTDKVRNSQGREALAANLVLEPTDAQQVAAIVQKCERDQIPLVPIGATRSCLRSDPQPVALSLARMNQIIAYESEDMTVVAQAGVLLGDLNRVAAQHGQRLPVDPPHPELTTIGSLIAGAKSGPIRLSEGTVRDLLIGITFVGHDGRVVHAGGRVVKNVAGYDLMKVLSGSYGTLGIIVEANFKVRPIPPNYTLVGASFKNIADAFAAAQAADEAVRLFHCEVLGGSYATPFVDTGEFVLLAGFGGIPAEADYQRAQLIAALGDSVQIFAEADAAMAYQQLCDFVPDESGFSAQIAVLPVELERCLREGHEAFRAHALNGVAQIYHANVGTTEEANELLKTWREIAHRSRGHVRVITAPPALRAGLACFDAPPAPAMALMRKLKESFDPRNIFNPGSFVGGL
ncbi:MAG TPA: FAD-binding oxidoreductase [Candidatus Binataceae bacterium]|nr:FAD-binding oxidoreductase [Candidatus Binataceae bacterium]